MEQLGEIGQNILPFLTDRELCALSSTSQVLRRRIEELPQLFWRARVGTLMSKSKSNLKDRRGVDWSTIYKNLASPHQTGFARGCNHLDTMKILHEAYPGQCLSSSDVQLIRRANLLRYVTDRRMLASPGVLSGLPGTRGIDKMFIQVIQTCPGEAVEMVEILDVLCVMFRDFCIDCSVVYNQLDVFETLIEGRWDTIPAVSLLERAIRSDIPNITHRSVCLESASEHVGLHLQPSRRVGSGLSDLQGQTEDIRKNRITLWSLLLP